MKCMNIFLMMFMLLALLPQSCSPSPASASASASTQNGGNGYVREACSVARYRDLCIHSLASFSNQAKRNPIKWARAGVSVTIGEAKSVARYLMKLKQQHGGMRGRNAVALSDCIECFGDTIDNLHRSLGVLRRLTDGGHSFNSQMGDVLTWLSAALTDQDTCLDGFDGQNGKQVKLLQNRVSRATCITSNALALVNKLATTAPHQAFGTHGP